MDKENQEVVAGQAAGGGQSTDQIESDVEALKAQIAEKDAKLAELEKSSAEKEGDLAGKVTELQDKFDKYATAQLTETQNIMLDRLTGGDAKAKERIIAEFNRLSDPADTPSQLQRKLEDAYLLAERKPVASPFVGSMGAGFAPMGQNHSDKTRYSDTPEGRDLARRLNMKFAKDNT